MFGPGFMPGFGQYGSRPFGPWGGYPGCGPYGYGYGNLAGYPGCGYGYGGYPGYDNLNVGNEGMDICISLPGIGSICMGQLASGLSAASIK